MPSPMISNPQETSAHKTTSNLALSRTGEKKSKKKKNTLFKG